MKFNQETFTYCLVLALFTAESSAAEDDNIISKVDDETLLTLSVVFLVVCGVFFLISVVAAIAIIRKVKSSGRGAGYHLEEREERYQTRSYQSMYQTGGAKSNGVNEVPPSQYESLKLSDSSKWIYQPVNTNESNGHVNEESKTIRTTPPGTEKGHKDSKENEKHKTLSSFQNPAYESSMPYGLDMKEDHNVDTAL